MIDYNIFGLSEITLGFIAVILMMILIDLNNKYELRRKKKQKDKRDKRIDGRTIKDGRSNVEDESIAKALGHMDNKGDWIVNPTKVNITEDDLKDEIDHYLKNDQGKI